MADNLVWRKKGDQFFDNNGVPLAGGKLEYRHADTDLLLTTFKDAALTVPHTNPIILTSSGRLADAVYVSTTDLKETLYTAADVSLFSGDDYPGALDTSVFAAAAATAFSTLGINATADTTNRLSVSSGAVLLNHDGASQQTKINKNLTAHSATILFQVGFSGRAEIGLAGNNNFTFKTSPDGSTWTDALILNATTGTARIRSSTVAGLPSAGTAGSGALIYVSNEAGGATLAFSDGTSWRRVADRAVVS